MKPITGQYECQHRSGVGLDYFTSLIDRLVLQTNGRFVLIVQDRSRLAHMAQSFIKGEQTNATAPAAEIRREGNFYQQGSLLTMRFDDGTQEQGQLTPQEDGIQLGKNLFAKVSDSPSLPSMQRMKKDMDDIAKGIKIATTLGGMAVKAAKTINNTIQSTQKPDPDARLASPSQPTANPNYPAQPMENPNYPKQPAQNVAPPAPQTMPTPPAPPSAPPIVSPNQAPAASGQPIYCEQCGNRCRPGKRFCNRCGAPLF